MNYRCPSCNATIKFSPQHHKLFCPYCEKTYLPTEISSPASYDNKPLPESVKMEKRRFDTIKMQILRCNSCAAELAMNNVEVSTYCPYCGQSTVELVRVEDYLRPDYILPFKLSQQDAEFCIRHELSQGRFVPDEIIHFKPDMIRGIYIPFWLFEIFYEDSQYWKYEVDKNQINYSHRVANTCFHHFTIDASNQLINASSERLEPYNMDELEPFDPAYLSGFYSDRFDTPVDEAINIALDRIDEMFTEGIKQTLDPTAQCISIQPRHQVLKEEYALLPAWFLTFRHEGKAYTILVNGQTGKVVAAVPFSKKKAATFFITRFILWNLFAVLLCLGLGWISIYLLAFPAIWGAINWESFQKDRKALKTGIALTRSSENRKYAEERQGE